MPALTFVEMVRSLMYREARFSKHYERINKDDDFHVEGLKLKPDEEPCGKFFPIPGLPESVLFTSLGLHWIEGDNSTFLSYDDIEEIDSDDFVKGQMRWVTLITKDSQRIKFPKEYPVPIPIFLSFAMFIAKVVVGYTKRKMTDFKE